MGSLIPAAKNLRTPARRTSSRRRKIHTPLRSGPSTEGSSLQAESDSGDPYRDICVRLHELLTRKRGYYGCVSDPLENALGVEQDGVDAVTYQVARIGEKIRRLRGPLEAISREKTLLDIAGHAVVAVACLARKES